MNTLKIKFGSNLHLYESNNDQYKSGKEAFENLTYQILKMFKGLIIDSQSIKFMNIKFWSKLQSNPNVVKTGEQTRKRTTGLPENFDGM